MRSIQDIFDQVIGARLYRPTPHVAGSSPQTFGTATGMCLALHYGGDSGVITDAERRAALKEVREYLTQISAGRFEAAAVMYLADLLDAAGMDSSAEAQRAIYNDWANRPRIT